MSKKICIQPIENVPDHIKNLIWERRIPGLKDSTPDELVLQYRTILVDDVIYAREEWLPREYRLEDADFYRYADSGTYTFKLTSVVDCIIVNGLILKNRYGYNSNMPTITDHNNLVDALKDEFKRKLTAHKAYTLFCEELITALRNTTNYAIRAKEVEPNPFLMGRVEAFTEVYERIKKEYDLAERSFYECPEQDTLKKERDRIVESIISTESARGNSEKEHMKHKIANAVEVALIIGYAVGRHSSTNKE